MLSAFTNCFKIPELRKRILFTLGIIIIVRLGSAIPAPGVDGTVLNAFFNQVVETGNKTNVLAIFNMFSGRALQHCAIFSLGIMPYISASIIMQLMTAVVPRFGKLAREEGGRAKITQYTRYMTLGLCLFQGFLLAQGFAYPESFPLLGGIDEVIKSEGKPLVPIINFQYYFSCVLTLTAGTMLMMWLGEKITERGIGQGISIIVMVGIIAGIPSGVTELWQMLTVAGPNQLNPITLLLLLGFLFGVIMAVISVTEATRKIPVSYPRRVVGRKVYGGQTNYMPLKVNYAGVMPIIFAQAILLFPQTILTFSFFEKVPGISKLLMMLQPHTLTYGLLYSGMIFFFSYFWVATMFNPIQIADDLKKYGGYIPGVRPGKPTSDFLNYTMTRITLAGATFLTIIAILPEFVNNQIKIPYSVGQFFGGTSLLIAVGVMLDTMRQIETHLLQRHYDGFLKKGRIRGRVG